MSKYGYLEVFHRVEITRVDGIRLFLISFSFFLSVFSPYQLASISQSLAYLTADLWVGGGRGTGRGGVSSSNPSSDT